ncbi:2-oxoglutarate receptor 1 [Ambystoma mexicanum]|uniref:2-oxoglutarate receptor 1 n=1 Tax=Ambystoma mexicanum TaxID=8296 RepID=UPI0037E80534
MNHFLEDSQNLTTVPGRTPDFENCTSTDALLTKYYLPALYGIIFIVAFPGNVVAIVVYVYKMRPWRSSIIIMLNLAITDLLYLASLPFLIYYYACEMSWDLGDFMCKFIRFSFNFNLYGSILFLTCFSVFRYFAIVHPLRYQYIHKTKWAVVACGGIWIVAFIAVLPMGLIIDSTDSDGLAICLDFASSIRLQTIHWYNWLLTTLCFFLPLAVVTFCYTRIIYSLANGPYTNDAFKKKARRLVVILLAVFYLCFLPFHILRIVRIKTRLYRVDCDLRNHINSAYIISRPIAVLNTFGNLLLYVAVGDNFQQAFLSICKCRIIIYEQQTVSNTDAINPS